MVIYHFLTHVPRPWNNWTNGETYKTRHRHKLAFARRQSQENASQRNEDNSSEVFILPHEDALLYRIREEKLKEYDLWSHKRVKYEYDVKFVCWCSPRGLLHCSWHFPEARYHIGKKKIHKIIAQSRREGVELRRGELPPQKNAKGRANEHSTTNKIITRTVRANKSSEQHRP